MNFIKTLFGWIIGIALALWLGAKVLLDALQRAVTVDDFAYLDGNVARVVVWVYKTAPWWVPAALVSALILTAMVKNLFRERGAGARAAAAAIAPAEAEAPDGDESPDDDGEHGHLIPIHEAIEHIARCTGDSVTRDCYAATRRALKQRAGDGSIRMRGCRQIDDPAQAAAFSEAETDIPKEYWAISGIGPMSVDADFADSGHTFPEPVNAWGSKGLFAKKGYSRLRVDWDEVVRLWPGRT